MGSYSIKKLLSGGQLVSASFLDFVVLFPLFVVWRLLPATVEILDFSLRFALELY